MKPFDKTIVVLIPLLSCQGAWAMDGEECIRQHGVVSSILVGSSSLLFGYQVGCIDGKNIGPVSGLRCDCVCCVGEKIVDCQQNNVEVYDLCDAGTALRFHMKATGPETPTEISFVVGVTDKPGGGGETFSTAIKPGNEEMHAEYYGTAANRYFGRVDSFYVKYKGAPFSGCRFSAEAEHKEMPIKTCVP